MGLATSRLWASLPTPRAPGVDIEEPTEEESIEAGGGNGTTLLLHPQDGGGSRTVVRLRGGGARPPQATLGLGAAAGAAARGGGSGPAVCIGQVHAGLEGDGCLWRKGILMGEKCQPPDFSGAIIYDAAGNVVKKPLR
ncbi:unnamed protein product [Spirodela intermedia]|uniref:Uncharacterized protein n=1 Tax=Spirodela intermedia TaxID=51605 RepID=A0A7I8JRE6_SPIIN|nr:unnamed protein product [Spirodela intermedia]CAA6672736.1 unnamed protein product [Spirodela intermedia]